MEHRASAAAATASRKLFAGKSAYDGVFAAPAKVGTAVEDYREIFCGGGGGGSSIPVLDVPELREGKVSVDVRGSEVDYADIFGGFGDLDYAVSLEELIGKLGRGCSSPEEARTPAYTRSPSEVSNSSNQASADETPCQSVGETKQVNMLYQKTNIATENGMPGTVHIAQLHAVPGYTRLIDENISSRKIEGDSPVSSVRSDIIDCVDETNDGKWSQKSMSDLPPGGFVKQTSQGSVEVQRRSMQNESFSNGIIFDENDFGLGTYPPQVQPPSNLSSKAGNSERESKGSVASDFESSTSDAADAGASSPPYFGEEVDENSVAAASAAAVKLAIEKAQARMRLAKELMERKKEGLQSGEKLIFKDGLRAQKKRGEKVAAKANILEEEKVREVNKPIKLSDWIKKKDAKVSEVTPGSGDTKELFTTKEAVEGKQKKEINIAHADHMPGEMKERETEPLCELVITCKHSATLSETDHVINNISSTNGFELGDIGMAKSRPEKPIDDSMQYEVVQEDHEWEDGVEKLYTYEGEKKLEVMQEHEEPEKLVRAPPEQDVCDEKRKEAPESMGILQNVDAQDLKENKNARLEETHEGVENGKTTVEAEEQEECTNALENIHETVTEVGILEDICRKEENGKILDESRGREENEMELEEPCKWEENEKQQNDVDADGEGNKEKSGVGIHDQEIIGKATNTVDEGEESEEYFEDSRSEEIEQLEGEENEKDLGEDKTREEETCEWTDTAEIWNEAFKYHGNNLEATDDTCRHDEHEHLSETKETCMQRESDKDDEATSEATSGATSSFEARDSEKGSESSVELANDLDYNEIFDTTNVTTDGGLELDEMMKEANDTCPLNANGADLGNEENRYNLKATYEEERWACSTEAEAVQQPSTSDRRERVGETAKESETSQSSQKIKENDCETSITEERETKYTGKKEAGLDKEHFKKLEEAKEREKEHDKKLDKAKEREKERMVVERAIREARERAFAEARERAAMEKLTAEARRKQVTEARERQGKASAEANYQSSADKEAKLKAERAAVERATAEARERALAKAKSGKAASDARNQAEKFSSSDTQSRASCPNSSNSELAQRAKAELERQQRTSERAAKALAEKNMRDLLAQKEQAERNRLAEALNADIKRWSSGKEKNLRALLSTLHYILGADSGWQPVPLTDIVATAAVKKTYRRATLIVHPDKLQQRGASIQQKYLCEKVFDLLKEAWEKFNKEER